MTDDTPGDYYRRKRELADKLLEACRLIREAEALDAQYSFYRDILKFLNKRLEAARYVD